MDKTQRYMQLLKGIRTTDYVFNMACANCNRPLMKRCREIINKINEEIAQLCGNDKRMRENELFLELCSRNYMYRLG